MSEQDLAQLRELVPLVIPIFIIQITLMIIALFDLAKRSSTRGPKWMWIIIILFINLFGPIAYFIVGREEE